MNTAHAINTKIETLTAKIANTPYTMEESKEAAEALAAMMSNAAIDFDELARLAKVSSLHSDLETLRQYQETAASDLMIVRTRYVITDTPTIVSPAGFTFKDRVYIQTAIAIHSDQPQTPARSNVPLYCHDVDAMAAK